MATVPAAYAPTVAAACRNIAVVGLFSRPLGIIEPARGDGIVTAKRFDEVAHCKWWHGTRPHQVLQSHDRFAGAHLCCATCAAHESSQANEG